MLDHGTGCAVGSGATELVEIRREFQNLSGAPDTTANMERVNRGIGSQHYSGITVPPASTGSPPRLAVGRPSVSTGTFRTPDAPARVPGFAVASRAKRIAKLPFGSAEIGQVTDWLPKRAGTRPPLVTVVRLALAGVMLSVPRRTRLGKANRKQTWRSEFPGRPFLHRSSAAWRSQRSSNRRQGCIPSLRPCNEGGRLVPR
jgi:hypothetical protein